MSFAWSFTICLLIHYVGTVVAKYTKARIGSGIFSIIVMLLCFWTGILPKDIVERGYFPQLYAIVMLVLIVHVGTTFDIKKIRQEWRVAAVIMSSIIGMGVLILTAGSALFGREMSMLAYPSLVGGSVATTIMRDTALERGWSDLAGIVIVLYAIQCWVGIPIITFGARKECKRLLALHRSGKKLAIDANHQQSQRQEEETVRQPLTERLPSQFRDPLLPLVCVTTAGAIATSITPVLEKLTSNIITFSVVALIVGVAGHQLGLIPKEPLAKAGVFPFFMFAMIMSLRGSLSILSPSDILSNIIPVVGLLLIGAAGILIFGVVTGRLLGFAPGLTIAFAFGLYAGYPINYQAALEVIELMADTPEEVELLKEHILSKVVFGAVIGVTITSIVIAGIFSGLI